MPHNPGGAARPAPAAGAAPGALSLDDSCLQHVFSFLHPLPDLFNAARACGRFRDVALTRRSWLLVTHAGAAAPAAGAAPAPHHPYRQRHATLAAAVAASRPGDTILLEPGPAHDASNVVIPHPLHILGGGAHPEDTVLCGAAGAEAVLDFRCTGRVGNVAIEATLGACVSHSAGRLELERCALRCCAQGLPHLVSPLLARACSDGSGGALAQQGVLSVAESSLQGGGSAVRLAGSGRLQAVRVICEGPAPLFWFEVDSAMPGVAQSAAPLYPPPATPALRDDSGTAPAWAVNGVNFDPVAFGRRIAALGAPCDEGRDAAEEEALELKAGLWLASKRRRLEGDGRCLGS